ncbi:MAG: hypothetical protein IIY18_00570, partial [Clostridia bacterium]|nr:hypothetical protein [Clostridia bacterium]
MREILYTVGIDGITPADIQYGGVAGEHNATKLIITVASDLYDIISETYYYRIDAVDSAGTHFIGKVEHITTNTITYRVPQSVTAAGGKAEIRIIFSKIIDDLAEKIFYSFPIKLRFDDSFHGDEAETKAAQDLCAIVEQLRIDGADTIDRIEETLKEAETAMAGAIRYDIIQDLTCDEKSIVLYNLGAIPWDFVAEDYKTAMNEFVLTYSALNDFTYDNFLTYTESPYITEDKKYYARKNVDIDGGKWELLYTIEGDGETKVWEYNQFADGSPLKLTAVSAVVIQDVAEAENSYGFLYAYSGAEITPLPAAIYNYFTKNSAPTTSGTQRAYGVIEQYKGQYRAYSVGMAKTGNEIMRYTPYMQAKHTTADYPYIDRIKVQKQTGVFSAGNKIEVYGVR